MNDVPASAWGWSALAAWLIAQPVGAQIQRAPEVVVSATRFEEPVGAVALDAVVITAEQIQRSAARTLPELLSTRAGSVVRDLFGNNAASANVDLRGFGANAGENTLILLDGRRISDADRSGVQWSAVPLEAIDRIEVLRGSGAVQYGAGATGGVINIVTRHPARSDSGFGAAVRGASWRSSEVSLAGGVFGETAGLRVFAHNYESDGYRDNNRNRQSNVALTGAWLGTEVEASARIAADRQGIRLPGPRTVQPSAGIDQLAHDRRGTSTPLDYAQRDGNQASGDVRWRLANGELALGVGYRDKAQRSYFDFGGFPDYRAIDLDVVSLQPRYRLRTTGFGARHALVLGADLTRWSYRLRRSVSATDVVRPFNSVRATQHDTGLYVLDTIDVSDDLTLNAGLRTERQRIAAADRFDSAAPGAAFGAGAPAARDRARQHAAELAGRLFVRAELALNARLGRSFRFANVDEIYETSPAFTPEFQLLRPQSARTYELGLSSGRAAPDWRATLYRIDVRDEIRLDPFSTGVGNTNLPPLRRQGLELEWRARFTERIEVFGAYTYARARFRSGILPGSTFTQQNVELSGRTVPLVPPHKFDLTADLAMSEATRARVQLQYVGARFMENDEGNTFGQRIPAYTVVDLRLVHRIGRFAVNFGVHNLFDRKYYAYAVRSQFVPDRFNAYPLPERTFAVTLEYGGS